MNRAAIDAWPVATSGLTSRPVTCLTRAGITTIGELRQWNDARLLALPAFGGRSLRDVRWFFAWTNQLEAGGELLPDLPAWLREFLTPRQHHVLEQRFGLTDPLFRPWLKRPTLREIGGERRGGITRERVRQIEAEALARLRTELARALRPANPGRYLHWGVEALVAAVAAGTPLPQGTPPPPASGFGMVS
ncbi:MAG: RNA polymerase sigma factor RpoS [Verrucomicrobiae bacterium]|nr:RNA polymerase sigma factor RpoS [Verrucomicrobiae bacterium]